MANLPELEKQKQNKYLKEGCACPGAALKMKDPKNNSKTNIEFIPPELKLVL